MGGQCLVFAPEHVDILRTYSIILGSFSCRGVTKTLRKIDERTNFSGSLRLGLEIFVCYYYYFFFHLKFDRPTRFKIRLFFCFMPSRSVG